RSRDGELHTVYMGGASWGQLPGSGSFVSVLDAIQGDGFNPLWQEVQISFNAGVTPQQLTSDNDIIAAANAGQITLTPTTEVYRCSVLGRKSSAAGVPKTIKRRVRHRDVPAVPRGGAGGRPDRWRGSHPWTVQPG